MTLNRYRIKLLAAVMTVFTSLSAQSATQVIYTQPMGNGSGLVAKPNLMYLMDNSGSMAWGYLPDYINDTGSCLPVASACAKGSSEEFDFGTPAAIVAYLPGLSAKYNLMYYNPDVQYSTPVFYDPTGGRIVYPQSPPTAAYLTPFSGVAGATSGTITSANIATKAATGGVVDLTTSFTNFKWCDGAPGTCITNDDNTGSNVTSGLYVNGTNDFSTPYVNSTRYNSGPYYYKQNGSPSFCSSSATLSGASTTGPCAVERDDSLYTKTYWGAVSQAASAVVPAKTTIRVNGVSGGTAPNASASIKYEAQTRGTMGLSGTVSIQSGKTVSLQNTIRTNFSVAASAANAFTFQYTTNATKVLTVTSPSSSNSFWTMTAAPNGANNYDLKISPTVSNPLYNVPLDGTGISLSITGSTLNSSSGLSYVSSTFSCPSTGVFNASTSCNVTIRRAGTKATATNASFGIAAISESTPNATFKGLITTTGNAATDEATLAAALFNTTTPANYTLSNIGNVAKLVYNFGAPSSYTFGGTWTKSGVTNNPATSTLSTGARATIDLTNTDAATTTISATVSSSTVTQSGNNTTDASGLASATTLTGANASKFSLSTAGSTLSASYVGPENVVSGPTFSGMTGSGSAGAVSVTNGTSSSITVLQKPTTNSTTVSASATFTGTDAQLESALASSIPATPAVNFAYTASGSTGTFSYTGANLIPGTGVATVISTSASISASISGDNVTFSANTGANPNSKLKVTVTVKNGATTVGGPWNVEAYQLNTGDSNNNRQALANAIVSEINGSGGFAAVQTNAACTGTGSTCQPLIRITAPDAGASVAQNSWKASFSNTSPGGGYATVSMETSGTYTNFSGYSDAVIGISNTAVTFEKMKIIAGNAPFARPKTRKDCASTNADATKNCTYAEELDNFANWFSYYRNRLAATKASVSISFDPLSETTPGGGWRVGLMLSGSSSTSTVGNKFAADELLLDNFDSTQKAKFYRAFQKTGTNGGTYLREMTSRAGWYFAGKLQNNAGAATDPMQYSCQLNAAFLSTDGYWNGTGGYRLGSTTMPDVPDQDGSSSTYNNSAPFFDRSNTSDTLSDTVLYYHDTDLRTSTLGNCTGSEGVDVCANNAPADASGLRTQKLIFYGLSFGMGGTVRYDKNYTTGGSADFNAINAGTAYWPTPVQEKMSAVDDLWHATVNGRGQFFNASAPAEVTAAFGTAITQLGAVVGAASAAATSSLEPVAGDNFAYVASYRTNKWDGDIQAISIDLSTGALSTTPLWSTMDQLDSLMAYSGVAPYPTASTAGRVTYTFDSSIVGTDKKKVLNWTNVNADATLKAYFDPALVASCGGAGLPFCTGETNQTLFEYLMGQNQPTGSFRTRDHVLGDVVYSQPVYVKSAPFAYTDAGYAAFKTSQASRLGAVYVGSNDGFLHAFNASTGAELWAYSPRAVLPNLYKLADTGYTHDSFVDGYISVADAQLDRTDASTWKTIMVVGLGNGGKKGTKGTDAYIGLDVTDPTAPKMLWEFTDATLGKTFGNPIITKVCTATCTTTPVYKWAALVANGYNSSAVGTLLAIDIATGAKLFSISTSSGTNSGLTKINNWVDAPTIDSSTDLAYGGDDDGNLWRFDIKNKTATKLAAVGEPISTIPQLALISGQKVVMFGTGRYLTISDTTDTAARGLYAIKDDGTGSTISSPQTTLVKNTLTESADHQSRTVTSPSNNIDWGTDSGWYIPLPDAGERVNVDPKFQLGVLSVATNVPTSSASDACVFGGYSWLNQIDIKTGKAVVNPATNPGVIVSKKIGTSLAVGLTVIKLPNGKLEALVTTSDNQHPTMDALAAPSAGAPKRVSWRDLSSQ